MCCTSVLYQCVTPMLQQWPNSCTQVWPIFYHPWLPFGKLECIATLPRTRANFVRANWIYSAAWALRMALYHNIGYYDVYEKTGQTSGQSLSSHPSSPAIWQSWMHRRLANGAKVKVKVSFWPQVKCSQVQLNTQKAFKVKVFFFFMTSTPWENSILSKMTVRGTMVRSEVCNSWCFCLES